MSDYANNNQGTSKGHKRARDVPEEEEGPEEESGGDSSEETPASREKDGATLGKKTRRLYLCRKCLAHGKEASVRRHKRNCPYKRCQCSSCALVNYGRFIVAKQISMYRYIDLRYLVLCSIFCVTVFVFLFRICLSCRNYCINRNGT